MTTGGVVWERRRAEQVERMRALGIFDPRDPDVVASYRERRAARMASTPTRTATKPKPAKTQAGKTCLDCKEVIAAADTQARRSRCSDCFRAYSRAEYHRNRERVAPKKAERAAQWRKENAAFNKARNRSFAAALRELKKRHEEEFEAIYQELLAEARKDIAR